MAPDFLTLDEILALHAEQIRLFGGSTGIRDLGLLDAAMAMPQATFSGQYLHPGLHEMAAAYLFHLVLNHPFVDGNKRTALDAALVFLELNDMSIEAPDDELTALVLGVIEGAVSKAAVAVFFEKYSV